MPVPRRGREGGVLSKHILITLFLLPWLLVLPLSAACTDDETPSAVVPLKGAGFSAINAMWEKEIIPLLREREGVSDNLEPRLEILRVAHDAAGAIEELTLVFWIEAADARRLRVNVAGEPAGGDNGASVTWSEPEPPVNSPRHLPAARQILRSLREIDPARTPEILQDSERTYDYFLWSLNPGPFEAGPLNSILSPAAPAYVVGKDGLKQRDHYESVERSFSYLDVMGVSAEEYEEFVAKRDKAQGTYVKRWSSAGNAYVVIPWGFRE